MPWQNHSWHTALYITSDGISTHGIPYEGRTFHIDFDFRKHELIIQCSDSTQLTMELKSMTVADFYSKIFELLHSINIDVKIYAKPNEIEPAIPFAENTVNKTYVQEHAHDLWQAMSRTNEVFHKFRSDFIGKASPVHLFWGAFDLAVTRFSGRKAPKHPGGMPNMSDEVMQEAYSQEVSSAGFWAGSKDFPKAVYYAYAYPTHDGFPDHQVLPEQAYYSQEMGEFFLDYEDVQSSDNPSETLMDFLRTTYEAAAVTGDWDRSKLERQQAS